MKIYNKPEIILEEIKIEDIMEVSKKDKFTDWEAGPTIGFSDLWL